MEAPQLLALQFTLSLVAYAALGFWYVRPWLAAKPRATALSILIFPQTFRFVGVTLLVPGVVEPGADLLLNLGRGVRLQVASQLGAAWFGPAFIVPGMLVLLVLVFAFLVRGRAGASA
jgi:hypothetical protein